MKTLALILLLAPSLVLSCEGWSWRFAHIPGVDYSETLAIAMSGSATLYSRNGRQASLRCEEGICLSVPAPPVPGSEGTAADWYRVTDLAGPLWEVRAIDGKAIERYVCSDARASCICPRPGWTEEEYVSEFDKPEHE